MFITLPVNITLQLSFIMHSYSYAPAGFTAILKQKCISDVAQWTVMPSTCRLRGEAVFSAVAYDLAKEISPIPPQLDREYLSNVFMTCQLLLLQRNVEIHLLCGRSDRSE